MRQPALRHLRSGRQQSEEPLPLSPVLRIQLHPGLSYVPHDGDCPLLHRQTGNSVRRNPVGAEQLSRTTNQHRIKPLRRRQHAHGEFQIGNTLRSGARAFFRKIVVRPAVMPASPQNGQAAQIVRLRQADTPQSAQQRRQMGRLPNLFSNGLHEEKAAKLKLNQPILLQEAAEAAVSTGSRP
jgi:hypothetical protein